jgi:hypothetical protein
LGADWRANDGYGSGQRKLQLNRGVGEFKGFEACGVRLMKQGLKYPKGLRVERTGWRNS